MFKFYKNPDICLSFSWVEQYYGTSLLYIDLFLGGVVMAYAKSHFRESDEIPGPFDHSNCGGGDGKIDRR